MRTALYDHHCQLNAKIVDFAGWQMPIHYKSILIEHLAVREAVGLFDVSHMGRILVEGPSAEKLLDKLSVSPLIEHETGTAIYTIWCNEQGGSVDDVMLFKVSKSKFFIIANADNRLKDLEHVQKHAKDFDVSITPYYEQYGILALQGPQALNLLSEIYPAIVDLKPMHFLITQDQGEEVLISRTGYTGAGGFEIFLSNPLTITLWQKLLQLGTKYGIEPIGLGARDTLRLEMGFALYGHELSDTIAPSESVAAWTDKGKQSDYIGKEALKKIQLSDKKRYAYGVQAIDSGIIRQNYSVIKEGNEIGTVTSGSFSPTLNQSVALILVNQPLEISDIVSVRIRQKDCRAQIVKIPFLRKSI